VEIYEVHTRKTLEQRTMELHTQSVSRSEKELSLEDELATKVNKENSSNVSLGVSVTAGVNFGVFHARNRLGSGLNRGIVSLTGVRSGATAATAAPWRLAAFARILGCREPGSIRRAAIEVAFPIRIIAEHGAPLVLADDDVVTGHLSPRRAAVLPPANNTTIQA
jgi:hypothetical protein